MASLLSISVKYFVWMGLPVGSSEVFQNVQSFTKCFSQSRKIATESQLQHKSPENKLHKLNQTRRFGGKFNKSTNTITAQIRENPTSDTRKVLCYVSEVKRRKTWEREHEIMWVRSRKRIEILLPNIQCNKRSLLIGQIKMSTGSVQYSILQYRQIVRSY